MVVCLAAPDVDSTIIQRESFRYGGNAEFRMLVARHSTLNVGYSYTKTDLSRDPIGSFDVQSIGANFEPRVVGVRVAEGRVYASKRARSRVSSAPSTRIQNLNIGVDYRKPLSRSRRSFLRFTTGSIISEQVAGITEPDEGPRIQAIGSRIAGASDGPNVECPGPNTGERSAISKDSLSQFSAIRRTSRSVGSSLVVSTFPERELHHWHIRDQARCSTV